MTRARHIDSDGLTNIFGRNHVLGLRRGTYFGEKRQLFEDGGALINMEELDAGGKREKRKAKGGGQKNGKQKRMLKTEQKAKQKDRPGI